MTPLPDDALVAVQLPDGSSIEAPASEVRRRIEVGFRDDSCAVCDRHVSKQGQGPHMSSHKRLVGDLPPKTPTPKRKPKIASKVMDEAAEAARLRKTDPVRPPQPKPEPMSTSDACLALVMGLTEQNTIPVHLFGEVQAWIEQTDNLIERLR